MNEPIHEERVYAFGPFLADPVARTLHRDGEPVVLSPKSFDVLLVLIRHRGDVVDKETLLRLVWNDRIVDENNLPRHISTLRKVLDDHIHKHIVTFSGRGYRFAAPIRELSREQSTAPAPPPPAPPVEMSEPARTQAAVMPNVPAPSQRAPAVGPPRF